MRQGPDRRGQDPCDPADVVARGILMPDANGLVRPLRECFPEHLLRAFRPGGERDDAAAVRLLEAHGLLESVLVGAVRLVVQTFALDVEAVRSNLKLEIRVRDLLEAHDDVQGHGRRA